MKAPIINGEHFAVNDENTIALLNACVAFGQKLITREQFVFSVTSLVAAISVNNAVFEYRLEVIDFWLHYAIENDTDDFVLKISLNNDGLSINFKKC